MNTAKQKNRLHTVLKWAVTALLSVLVLAIGFVCIARTSTYFSNHITSENGIDEGIYVTLGGQEQYLLIRGEDRSNPVIIWLHGGPSSPDGFINYAFTKYLTDDFTIVCWDQRGSGRTYFRNKSSDPENRTATFEQALLDLDHLVNYICERFNTDSVILVDHSYGTMLASKYALTNPNKVNAFIGVGQVVSIESDIYSYMDALTKAQEKGEDTKKLEKAYQTFVNDKSIVNILALRRLVIPYHPVPREANTIWLGIASPYMGINDLRWFIKQNIDFEKYINLNKQLFDYILTADVRNYGINYQVPAGFISGACDWITPVRYSEDYFNLISAPKKDFLQLDGCGHAPQYDAPEDFSAALKEMLNNYIK